MRTRHNLFLLLLLLGSVGSVGCASDSGPGSVRQQLDELTEISQSLGADHTRIVTEYQAAEADLAELETRHGVISPTDRPRIRKLLLECFNVQVETDGDERPCATLSSYTLATLKTERPAEFAAVVDERLHRTAKLRYRLKQTIPNEAERMAEDYVRFLIKITELRAIADSVHSAAQAYNDDEIADLNTDYARFQEELQSVDRDMRVLELELNEAPARVRQLLYRALQAITN